MYRVNFKGSSKELGKFLETLILLYGETAKIADIAKSIQSVKGI